MLEVSDQELDEIRGKIRGDCLVEGVEECAIFGLAVLEVEREGGIFVELMLNAKAGACVEVEVLSRIRGTPLLRGGGGDVVVEQLEGVQEGLDVDSPWGERCVSALLEPDAVGVGDMRVGDLRFIEERFVGHDWLSVVR